jgi:hypothetical protein
MFSVWMNEKENVFWQFFEFVLIDEAFFGIFLGALSVLQSRNPCAYVTADDQAEYC